MQQQLEIKFFFPLTEQIPMDLDFTESDRYVEKLKKERWESLHGVTSGITYTLLDNSKITTPIWQNPIGELTVEADNIVFKVKKKPNLFKRGIYKLIGLKWRVK